MFWRFLFWILSLATLPARALVALRREKQLLAQLSELQDRLDSLAWDKRELQEHIRTSIKDYEMMEMMLGELEDEHDEAIRKIKLLETELQNLNDENLRLKEIDGKSEWDAGAQVDAICGYSQKQTKDCISTCKSDKLKGLTDILMQKNEFEDENRSKLAVDYNLGQRWEVAFSQSLFSAILSLSVGMIIREAEEPCMPLVTALFMVVGMSLKSVVELFLTVKNKAAYDAVALLSLNWFILGTLAYPTLPTIAHLTAPVVIKLLKRALGWF